MWMAVSPPACKSSMDRLLIVMGVAGCGKSTIGSALATELGAHYLDGDDFHPHSNIAKMSAGEPLTDEDRQPWLAEFGHALSAASGKIVGGCSALKRQYRDRIRAYTAEPTTFIHLAGDRSLIAQRIKERQGHYMPPSLLDSQFEALEPPSTDEGAITVDIACSTRQIVANILSQLNKGPSI